MNDNNGIRPEEHHHHEQHEEEEENGVIIEEEQHIRVLCRVRPPSDITESGHNINRKCIVVNEDGKTIFLNNKPFTFDHAVGENGTQETLFELVGRPVTSSCLQGYNGTIFCYGQTGSGKTYTMFGDTTGVINNNNNNNKNNKVDIAKCDLRGIVPRVMDYIFGQFERDSRLRSSESVIHLCRCSFYEIFNEKVFDLLDAASGGLQVREDMKKGVYVEGLIEETVTSTHDAFQILTKGYRNRHVGATAMNRESSRSHAVFSLSIESKETNDVDGLTKSRIARFNLVDLAGSERQSVSRTTGERLKEAGMINKSLSTLGNVINALVEVENGKTRHIQYRDSKLTFLLRDSIGGNAKTFLVATVSPADVNFAETLSTLKFANRVKMIKNKAIVNEDTAGTVEALNKQIRYLKKELLTAQAKANASSLSSSSLVLKGKEIDDPCFSSTTTTTTNAAHDSLMQANLERSINLQRSKTIAERKTRAIRTFCDRLEIALTDEKLKRRLKENRINYLTSLLTPSLYDNDDDTKKQEDCDEINNLKQENEILQNENDKVSVEAIKWRVAYDEAEEKLIDLQDDAPLWSIDNEKKYNHMIEKKIFDILTEKDELIEKVNELNDKVKQMEATTNNHEARENEQHNSTNKKYRQSTDRQSDGAVQHFIELQTKIFEYEREVSTLKTDSAKLVENLAEARQNTASAVSNESQLQLKVVTLERKIAELNEENKLLNNEREKDMSGLQNRIRSLEEEQVSIGNERDNATLDLEGKFAKVCKDNTILFQRLKATIADVNTNKELFHNASKEYDEILLKLKEEKLQTDKYLGEITNLQKDHDNEMERFQIVKSTLESKFEEKVNEAIENKIKYDNEKKELEKSIISLKAKQDQQTSDLSIAIREKEDKEFQLSNLQEDHDTLLEKSNYMEEKNLKLEDEITVLQKKQEDSVREIIQLVEKGAILELSMEANAGDNAADQKRLHETERKNEELDKENKLLSNKLSYNIEELKKTMEEIEGIKKMNDRSENMLNCQIKELHEKVKIDRDSILEYKAKYEQMNMQVITSTQERDNMAENIEKLEETSNYLKKENEEYMNELEQKQIFIKSLEEIHERSLKEITVKHQHELEISKLQISNLQGDIGFINLEYESLQKIKNELKTEKEQLKLKIQELEEKNNNADDDNDNGEQNTSMKELLEIEKHKNREKDEKMDNVKISLENAEKNIQKYKWEHSEEIAKLHQKLADALAAAAESATLQSKNANLIDSSDKSKEKIEMLERQEEESQNKLRIANAKVDSLAKENADMTSLKNESDQWKLEKAKWKIEIKKAREMEKEAYERSEQTEAALVKLRVEHDDLNLKFEEEKSANLKLVGHQNAKQRIQLTNKYKDDINKLQDKVKELEHENYILQNPHKASNKKEGLVDVTNRML